MKVLLKFAKTKQEIMMTKLFKPKFWAVLLGLLSTLSSLGQTIIGSFPQMDGGFEGQATGTIATLSSIANGIQRTDWTVSAGSGTALINATNGRSGAKYFTAGASSATARRFQSPTAANGAVAVSTAYTIQFFYKTAVGTAATNAQANASPDGTGSPGTYQALTLPGTNGVWTKIQQSVTTGSSANATRYGISLYRYSAASTVDVDIDDWVMYAGAADNTAPNLPGTVTVANPTVSSLDVSWAAASGGVDGGGYVVVRYATAPNADNDPNQNGIYAIGNTFTNGTGSLLGRIVYIGTGTSFTDNTGLSAGQTYYYKVYTVDKAFNYSTESEGNGTTSPPVSPTLTLLSALPDFGNVCVNTIGGPNSFTIKGDNLDGTAVSLAALTGYTYSETVGGPFTTILNFNYAGNGFASKLIYVNFNPVAVQQYTGNISLTGGGIAGSLSVAANGYGINEPTLNTGGTSGITSSTATLAGTIVSATCSPVATYGFEYSTISGFINGTGTQVFASNLNSGNFSQSITGLIPNTRYYYKAFATNNNGATGYGPQQAFTCLPLPVPMALQSGLSYTQNFSDVGTWGDFFTSGNGANHFGGLSANATGTIPDGIRITASTANFNGSNFTSSGGVHRFIDATTPTQSIIFLSTGSPDNTTSAALDFYMDFTGVNAGTLSFDYATINNSTGDRNGSLRVYATTDGITFTELPFANVLNFTNNVPISGSKTNIALPAIFDNSATARLRFYYHNGSGNTGSGSRPKISIDNLNVTAVATTPCVSPTAPATALTFGTITDVSIAGSFTAASPASDGYMVVMSTNNALTGNPIDGVIYNIGDNVGDGSVIANGNATTFTATGLTALTTYYFFVFPVNSVCTGGPLYYTATVLNDNATTIAGLPPCAAPAGQPANYVAGTTTINSIQGSFTATTADEYLVLRTTAGTLSNNPVNAQAYNAGDILGNAVVVQRSAATSFTATGLLPNTTYNFFIFALNSQACINGPVYNIVLPLTGTQATLPLPPCATPSAQPTSLTLTPANTSIAGTFTGVIDADDYLIIRSSSNTLSASPVDNTDYNAGDNFGGGIVIANSTNTSFLTTGLTANTQYYFYIFAANKNCSGGTKYFLPALTGNITTTNAITNNYYFGTLHSHSDYSDGNKDNPGFTPADDYAYAKNSLCMDFLGISEHNHYSGGDPGNLLAPYHSGITQANTFTTNNPGFLALYGMEWGTISGGGHVLVYGNGMDDLWGWESGSGVWGAANNYDVYVPKSGYTGSTGLFKTINDNAATNTFGSLAHPNLTDFNNIAGTAYDVVADNAITATTVESGPSSSTNTTYSAPGSSMGYLFYYQMLLAKGYHLGPTIDHDNHYTTFGRTTYSRTAVIAPGPTLTKASMMTAMRNMNFYATQDCDSKVDFSINTRIMGNIFTDRFAPNIAVTLTDATTSTATAVIRVMYGVPGSGVLPVKIDSVIGSTLNFTDNNLANNTTGYYYIDITNGSSRIVTSPIWYTRNDGLVLPVKLSSFVVQKTDNAVKISWSTEQETNSSHFVVERSVDGRTWNSIAIVNAAGNSSTRINYSIYDNAPVKGINYYRLKQVDKDAKYDYSVTRTALFSTKYAVEVAPNPAKDVVNIYLAKTTNQPATIQLLNAAGKIVYNVSSAQSHVQINTSGFGKGLYFVKVIAADEVTTIRVLVQ